MRTLGATGLGITRMGLGLAALGRPAYITLGREEDLGEDRSVEALERRAHAVLDAAWAAGLRYFDVARSYGRGEDFLGSWLEARGRRPGELTVGSKWGYAYTGGWHMEAEHHEVKDLSAAQLRRQREESLDRLGDWLGLYQIHSATLESGVLGDAAVLVELARLRADGIAVGLSVSGPRQGETIDRALEVGGFDCVQATWNLFERSAGPALARAHAAGLGVIVKEGVANGLLTPRGALPALEAAAAARGTTSDALALAAVSAQPWADVVLSGAATEATLRANLAAQDVAFGDAEDAELADLAQPAEDYWAARGSLSWS